MNQETINKLVDKGIMIPVTPFNNLYSLRKENHTLIYGRRMGEAMVEAEDCESCGADSSNLEWNEDQDVYVCSDCGYIQ